jgi:hypothetical protein
LARFVTFSPQTAAPPTKQRNSANISAAREALPAGVWRFHPAIAGDAGQRIARIEQPMQHAGKRGSLGR